MAQYAVYFFCNECGDTHDLGISIGLDDGPADETSIGDTYNGKELPPEIAMLTGNMTTCPKTGRLTSQKNNDQVFLVPVA